MNKTLRNLLRVAGVAVGIGAAIWAMRDKLLPAPNVPDEPPARFRTGPGNAPPPSDGDDLTAVKGIGPVYASRLDSAGLASYAALAAADAAAVATAAGVSEAVAQGWIDRAAAFT